MKRQTRRQYLDADNSALAMVYGAFNESVACMPPPCYMSPEVLASSNFTILSEYQLMQDCIRIFRIFAFFKSLQT